MPRGISAPIANSGLGMLIPNPREERMRSSYTTRRWLSRLFAGAGITVLSATAAHAQVNCPPSPCPPIYGAPGVAIPPPSGAPGAGAAEAPSPNVGPEGSAQALSGGSVAMAAPGYVDFAVPTSQFRL